VIPRTAEQIVWTGAREASFSTCLVRRRLNVIAAPGPLNRYVAYGLTTLEKKFKVLVTNGEWLKEFLYFVQNAKGDFYLGQIGIEPNKTSVHASGVTHMRTGSHRIPLGHGTKLSDLKGLRQLFSVSIGRLVFGSPYFGKEYSGKPTNGLITVDIRRFKTDIGIMAFLLEPDQAGNLNALLRIIHEPQFYVVTETQPWLVIAIHSFKQVPSSGAT
jgi:hypothetical protein